MAVFEPFYMSETLLKTSLLPHRKSEVAGGSKPLSASRKGGDSVLHAICNPMSAERDVQTEKFEKGPV